MSAGLVPGLLYATIVFAAGFVLGTLRALAVAPLVGETTAVLLELPVILAISWVACQLVIRHLAVPPALDARATMGVVALAAILAAEAFIVLPMLGRSPAEFLATFRSIPAMVGLGGQLVYALFPLIQGKTA